MDLIVVIESHSQKSYYLGFGISSTRSNLAKANENRDSNIFEEFAYHLIDIAHRKCFNNEFEIKGKIYAFDSSTIELCLSVFWWAKFRRTKAGRKLHNHYDVVTQIPAFIHITAATVHDENAVDKTKGKQCDQIGRLTGFYVSKEYPDKIRRIKFYDEETHRTFIFLTNNMELSALEITLLYIYRWQVELFFKWLKQHLKIKAFWGKSENTVRIQIYSAIIAYCLVAIVGQELKINRSTYEILQVLGISLLDKTPVKELLANPDYNDAKEHLYKPLTLNLF